MRRATIAVSARNAAAGLDKIEYILREHLKTASVQKKIRIVVVWLEREFNCDVIVAFIEVNVHALFP